MKDASNLVIEPNDVERLYRISKDYSDGVTIHLRAGEYIVDRTIFLPSNTSIIGAGKDLTRITLTPGSHCHLFTNLNHKVGNTNLTLRDFSVEGNGDTQERQAHHKALTFCCAIYIKRTQRMLIKNIDFFDIRQTATHFNGSEGIVERDCDMRKLGWSGVSTSNASNMQVDVTVSDAGRDTMHSAVHLDGGVGIHCRANISGATGNGIMLDSAYAALRHVVVEGSASHCKRGVSLSGSAEKALEIVLISGRYHNNMEVGAMVSNARHVVLSDCKIWDNGEIGLLFQGRNGGRDCMIFNCEISGNPENIKELHASGGNWVFSGDVAANAAAGPNRRSLECCAAPR